MTRSL